MKRTALALALLMSSGWACSPQPLTRPCHESDVGTDPPASVRFVGQNQQEVPFDSWSCPGFSADALSDLVDFRVLSVDGTFNVFVVTDSANDVSAVGDPVVGNRADLSTELIEPGQFRITVPDPTIEWSIRLRIATPDDRVAYYAILLAPPA